MLVKTLDGLQIDFNFDPSKYKTAGGAAKAFHRAVREVAKSYDQNPDIEVQIWKPGQDGNRAWRVAWEAGPFEWAIAASEHMRGEWGYTEPHYSFDLCFAN